ncbi:MAG: murein biosynthesis integral membrane protein MurJ [Actinomycetes bacterium]
MSDGDPSEATAVARNPGTGRAAAGMGAAVAVSRGIGFLRILTIAAVLGTTYLGNTYSSSNAVSNVIFELLAAGALSAVLVPTFTNLFADRGREEVERLAGGLLGLSLIVLGALVVLGEIFAAQIARLLTSGVADPAIAAQQQDLSTFLLRFMIPQILLYAFGAVAVGTLHAQRRFIVPALAPIALTAVVVTGMVTFRLIVGSGNPGLDLEPAARLCLALTATLGVAAFVAMPVVAMLRTGVRPRIHIPRRDPALGRLLRLSGWAILQHAAFGLLLGVTIVIGNAVRGGTVAYQVAFVFFTAPYAVLAAPVHTTVLPELARDAAGDDLGGFAAAIRWAIDAMAMLLLPVAAGMIALAAPGMRAVAFGNAATEEGVHLLAVAVATLAVGLLPYSVFFLLARACYALDDSRLPATLALSAAVVTSMIMVVVAPHADGAARVAVLGLGNTVASLLAATALGFAVRRRLGHAIVPRTVLRSLVVAVLVGLGVHLVASTVDPAGRIASLLLVLTLAAIGGAAYLLGIRLLGARIDPRIRRRGGGPPEAVTPA